jgi:hypothetical protein
VKIRSVAYLSILAWLLVGVAGTQSQDPLPSWNKGVARQAILNYVHTTTDPSSPNFVPPEQRIAAFYQDGTTWVEHPIYTQLQFVLDRVVALAPQHPEWKTTPPFQAVLSGDKGRARDKRWNRPYTELIYQPMLEVMHHLRANGYKTYIVTGGGQEFVRVYDRSGKPEDSYLFTGRHPRAAFGNSTGDRQMLDYAQASGGSPLMMLVLHDDARREFAYGPARGLPDTKVGAFSQALCDEAAAKKWLVISMKKDWNRIFSFEKSN